MRALFLRPFSKNRRTVQPAAVPGPVRLYMLIPLLSGGGAERVAGALLEGLSRERFEITLLTLAPGLEGTRIPGDVRVIPLRSRSFKMSLPRLVWLFRRSPPDILLSHMSLPNTWAVLARRLACRRFPVVCVEHTVPSAAYSQGTRMQALIPKIMRAAYRSADAVVACSGQTAEDLVSAIGLPRARIDVIESPVLSRALERLAAEPVGHPWLQSTAIEVVLAVGRLVGAKDFATLIRAFGAVSAHRPQARLLIYGEGSQRSELEDLVASLGLQDRVALPGRVENPYAAMSQAAVFVVSSLFEGGPLTLIEAMACGVRIVSTAVGVAPDVLKDGAYGILVEPGDEKALAAAIEGQLRGEGPPPAPVESVSRFRRDVSVSAYDELLESLLERARA